MLFGIVDRLSFWDDRREIRLIQKQVCLRVKWEISFILGVS